MRAAVPSGCGFEGLHASYICSIVCVQQVATSRKVKHERLDAVTTRTRAFPPKRALSPALFASGVRPRRAAASDFPNKHPEMDADSSVNLNSTGWHDAGVVDVETLFRRCDTVLRPDHSQPVHARGAVPAWLSAQCDAMQSEHLSAPSPPPKALAYARVGRRGTSRHTRACSRSRSGRTRDPPSQAAPTPAQLVRSITLNQAAHTSRSNVPACPELQPPSAPLTCCSTGSCLSTACSTWIARAPAADAPGEPCCELTNTAEACACGSSDAAVVGRRCSPMIWLPSDGLSGVDTISAALMAPRSTAAGCGRSSAAAVCC
jgi:hypothetical protein